MAFCESWQFRAEKLCYTAIIESVEQRFGALFRAAVAQLAEPPPCKRRVVRSMRTGGPISRDPVTGHTERMAAFLRFFHAAGSCGRNPPRLHWSEAPEGCNRPVRFIFCFYADFALNLC